MFRYDIKGKKSIFNDEYQYEGIKIVDLADWLLEISRKDTAELHLGVLSTYSGDEFNRAVSAFSEKYPAVELKVITRKVPMQSEALMSAAGFTVAVKQRILALR